MKNKNIIVGVDFSNSSLNAMRHAVSIAMKTGADLHLVWVKTPGVAHNVADDGNNYINKGLATLEDWKNQCKMESPETEVNTVILEGKVHIELNKFAANQPNAMIVMGTHGTSGFEEGYIGNNVNRLIKSATVPILTMRENIEIKRDLHNIYAPIDLSFETLQKMRYATYLGKRFAAKDLHRGHLLSEQRRHAPHHQRADAPRRRHVRGCQCTSRDGSADRAKRLCANTAEPRS